MNSEKRIYTRANVSSTSVTIEDGEGYINGMIADISLKGVSLFAGQAEFKFGEHYNLKFNLPVRGKYLPVQLEGKAIYGVPHSILGPKIGFQVSSIDTLSLWTIESFLKTLFAEKAWSSSH